MSQTGIAGTNFSGSGERPRGINRIGTAVPAFDVHDAFVEYAGSLLTGNEPGCSMRFLKSMLLRWRKNALYDFGIGRVQDGLAYRLSGSKCCCRGKFRSLWHGRYPAAFRRS